MILSSPLAAVLSYNPVDEACVDITSSLLVPPLRMVEGGFHNMTDVFVPPDVATLLSFGPRFVPTRVMSFGEYVSRLYVINDMSITMHKDPAIYLRGYMMNTFDTMLGIVTSEPTSMEKKLKLMLSKTLQFLETHPTLILAQSDKGKSVVLISKDDYHERMSELVEKGVKKGAYQKQTDVAATEAKTAFWCERYNNLCNQLLLAWTNAKKASLPLPFTTKMKHMLPIFNKPDLPLPYLYGSLKTHKDGVPCRPICSTRTWHSYPLQKIISHNITSVMQRFPPRHNVSNIDDAAAKLRSCLSWPGFEFMKLDIEDMYTNMDRIEIINLVRHIVSSPIYRTGNHLDGDLLVECLELCLGDNTLFTYDGAVYKQLRGLPQGACDSALLATLLLDHILDVNFHEIISNNHVVFFMKYVDDFCFFLPRGNKDRLHEVLTYYTQLSYTAEAEEPSPLSHISGQRVLGRMSFLDLELYRCTKSVFVKTYTKPMVSQRICHYLSLCDVTWKNSTITYYVRRVLLRVSNVFLLEELYALEYKFLVNMYPRILTSNCMIEAITSHLNACRVASLDLRRHNFNPLLSLGNMSERANLLSDYIHDIGDLPPIYFRNFRRHYQSYLGRQAQLRQYNPPITYYCEEMTGVLRRIYSLLDGGVLTQKNGPSLFSLLRMQMNRHSGLRSVPVSRARVWITKCPDCDIYYLLCGEGNLLTVLDQVMSHVGNPINTHMRNFDHQPPSSNVPDPLKLDSHSIIPIRERIMLMKAVFGSLGYECVSCADLLNIPNFVRLGLNRYLNSHHTIDNTFNIRLN